MFFPSWLKSLFSSSREAAAPAVVASPAAAPAIDPAFSAGCRSWNADFTRIADKLVELSRTTENDFLEVGANLHAISEDCSRVSSLASSLVRLEDSGSGFHVGKFENLFNKAFESTGACAASIPAGLAEMNELNNGLEKISVLRSYLDSLSRSITVIGVLTRIETSRIDGSNFNSMTTVVDDLGRQIARSTEEIAKSARDSKQSIIFMSEKLGKDLEQFKGESTAADQNVRIILEEMRDMRTRATWACKRIDGRSAQIIPEIGEIVSALQYHDICRQKMEHVAKTLTDAAERLAGLEDAAGDERAALKKWLVDVVRIQVSQLEQVIAETAAAAEGISSHLTRISDLSDAQAEDTNIILEEEDSGSRKTEKIMAELEALLMLNARCKAMTTDMITAVTDASGRIGTMSEHVSNIVAISDSISMLAINALINVARTGDSGRTLAVLADKIRSLSEQAKVEIAKGAEIITAILTKSTDFKDTLSASLNQQLVGADQIGAESHAAVPELIAADKALITSMSEIAKTTDRLRTDIERLVTGIRFAETIRTGLGASAAQLRTVLRDVDATVPDVAGAAHMDLSADFKDLTRRYTMESEREVHDAVVAGAMNGLPAGDAPGGSPEKMTIAPTRQGDAGLGNNVELF